MPLSKTEVINSGLVRSPTGSLALASRDADLDPPCRYFGVFLLANEVELRRADVGMPANSALRASLLRS